VKALIRIAYGPLSQLSVQEVPSPQASPGELVIDVKASSLNFPDALMVQGFCQVKPPLPFSPARNWPVLSRKLVPACTILLWAVV
jgi:NADPH2:quinone reductase